MQEKEQPFRKASMLTPSYDVVFLRDLCHREADRYRVCRHIVSSRCHSIFYSQDIFPGDSIIFIQCNTGQPVLSQTLGLFLQYRVVFHISQVSHQIRSSQYFFASGNDVSVISWTTLQKGQGKWLRRQDRSSEATHTEQTSFRQGVLTSWSTIFWHKPHVRSSNGTVTNGRKRERERGDDLLCDGNVVHKILCY